MSDSMSTRRRRRAPAPSLAERRSALTEDAILDAALDILVRGSVSTLTVRSVAEAAGISERTVFRYFQTRDAFLDAIAAAAQRRMDAPPAPASIEELASYPRRLYQRFEAEAALTRAALHSEIFDRIRRTAARGRWDAVLELIEAHAPQAPARERRIAAANIRYFLSATAWHYHRVYFGFDLEDTIACAEAVVHASLGRLGLAAGTKTIGARRLSGSRRG